MRHRRACGRAEQAERGFEFDGELDIGQPQRLLRLVEHGPAPDVHIGLAAEAEEASFSLAFTSSEISQAVARCRDAGAFHRDVDRARADLPGKVFPANCAATILLISVKGMSIGTPIATLPASAARW